MSLNVQITGGAASAASVDVLALYALEGDLSTQKHLAAVDKALGGGLLSYAKHADFQGKLDQCLEVVTLGKIKPRHVLLVGVGKGKKLDKATLRAFSATACRYANGASAKSIALVLPEGSDLRSIAEGVGLGAYRFTRYMTGERVPKAALKDVKLYDAGSNGAAQKKAIALGLSIADAVCLARDSVNEPPNELYPESLAQMCRKMAKKAKLKIEVFDKKGILSRKMLLHYAVGQGSAHEPRFIHMSYVPKKAKKKLVFVGKGLTFDSGGLCIKPAPGMGEMKSDMAGAGAVLGLMAAVGALRPNVEVHGIIASAENMPDAAAYRPGDIFGSLSGKTVEIINTDAEGRLVLADALAYASKLKPTAIIDAATLTGACMVALGKTCSAFYTPDADLAKNFEAAAGEAGEQFWRMPLLEDLREQLKSDVADLKHTGERWGGSISAALFLREFVTGPWIHCDIAGPVLGDRAKGMYPKGGTGHPVLTFLNFVENAG